MPWGKSGQQPGTLRKSVAAKRSADYRTCPACGRRGALRRVRLADAHTMEHRTATGYECRHCGWTGDSRELRMAKRQADCALIRYHECAGEWAPGVQGESPFGATLATDRNTGPEDGGIVIVDPQRLVQNDNPAGDHFDTLASLTGAVRALENALPGCTIATPHLRTAPKADRTPELREIDPGGKQVRELVGVWFRLLNPDPGDRERPGHPRRAEGIVAHIRLQDTRNGRSEWHSVETDFANAPTNRGGAGPLAAGLVCTRNTPLDAAQLRELVRCATGGGAGAETAEEHNEALEYAVDLLTMAGTTATTRMQTRRIRRENAAHLEALARPITNPEDGTREAGSTDG